MKLTIKSVDAFDFGSYKCVAKNSLGDTDGAIKLYRKHKKKKKLYIIFLYVFWFFVIVIVVVWLTQNKNKSKSKARNMLI